MGVYVDIAYREGARITRIFETHRNEDYVSGSRDRPITTFCGSGQRAIIAASILKRTGFNAVEVCLGSMAACRALGCAP